MGPGPTHPLPNYFWIFGIFLTLQSPLGALQSQKSQQKKLGYSSQQSNLLLKTHY